MSQEDYRTLVALRDDELSLMVKVLKKRADNDMDSVVAITGQPGIGKSVLSLQFGLRIQPIDFNKNIIWSRQELETAISDLPKKSVIIPDEAIDLLYKREFANRDQIKIVKLLNKCRKLNHTFIMNIPNFKAIDKDIRNERVRYWIHIVERGTAFVFSLSENFVKEDRWHLKEIEKVIDNEHWNGLTKIPTFRGILHFDDLPRDIKRDYLATAEQHAKQSEEQEHFTKHDLIKAEEKGVLRAIILSRDNNLYKNGALSRLADLLKHSYGSISGKLTVERRKWGQSSPLTGKPILVPSSPVPVTDEHIVVKEKWEFGDAQPE